MMFRLVILISGIGVVSSLVSCFLVLMWWSVHRVSIEFYASLNESCPRHVLQRRQKESNFDWLYDIGRSAHSKWNCTVSAKKVYINHYEITRAKLVAKATTVLPFFHFNKNKNIYMNLHSPVNNGMDNIHITLPIGSHRLLSSHARNKARG